MMNMKPIFIAGPCVIESAELLDVVAQKLVAINKALGTDIIFVVDTSPSMAAKDVDGMTRLQASQNFLRK